MMEPGKRAPPRMVQDEFCRQREDVTNGKKPVILNRIQPYGV